MRKITRKCHRRRRTRFLLGATLVLAFSTYINQVVGLQSEADANQWPSMPRRNIAALAREGYLRSSLNGLKRSISTLAKNGQLPTYRAPYDETDKQETDDEESPDKRNLASIARLRSYSTMKRNIQALARDGHRFGRGQYQQTDKRNIQSLARNGLIHKKDEILGDEYYYPFYQNPIPPLSEVDGPYDFNELYDLQQSINPDMFPPLSRISKRSDVGMFPNMFVPSQKIDDGWNYKRGSVGLPALGIYRPIYTDPNGNRNKRSIYSIPDVLDKNDIDDDDSADYDSENEDKRSVDEGYEQQNFVKRHIGSLARYGLLPTFRYTGGRYSRSGRARLLLPSQDYIPPFRKYSTDENVELGEYISNPEVDPPIDSSDDPYLPPPAIPAHPHPTGRYFHRALSNDLPPSNTPPIPPPLTLSTFEPTSRNRWQQPREPNKFYYFRSLKVPHHTSGKRYLLLPAVDKAIRKSYRNSSLPSRRKNL